MLLHRKSYIFKVIRVADRTKSKKRKLTKAGGALNISEPNLLLFKAVLSRFFSELISQEAV